jgi:hypothetical protein
MLAFLNIVHCKLINLVKSHALGPNSCHRIRIEPAPESYFVEYVLYKRQKCITFLCIILNTVIS